MFLILVGVVIMTVAPTQIPERFAPAKPYARLVGALTIVFAALATSFFHVSQNGTGHLNRIYASTSLPDGRIIAINNEKGPQAHVYPPGFHFSVLVSVLNRIEEYPVVVVPDGKVGILLARDGSPMRADQAFADPLHSLREKGGQPVDVARAISDAAYFLASGGQKGPQSTVLTPGSYRLNMFLWDVQLAEVVDVPQGHVAVVKSNVYGALDLGSVMTVPKPAECSQVKHADPRRLSAPLVPVGCIGIWERPLPPGRYYMNPQAYMVTKVDTRQQAWLYRGGYDQRSIALTLDKEGNLAQRETTTKILVPKEASDSAIDIKVEGWTMHQAVRALVQIRPDDAPFVVASLGGIAEVEDRVVTPALQSLLRNIAGGFINVPNDKGETVLRATHALDFVERREFIEKMLEPALVGEAAKAGVLMQEVRLLETDFPPELLVARKREQLADQLRQAYAQERVAQQARIAVEQQKATADQQPELVRAEIAERVAIALAKADAARGTGVRDRLVAEAAGQREQATVLGQDRVMQLQIIAQVLAYLDKNPKALESLFNNAHKLVPNTVVNGTAGGFDLTAVAAMLMGAKNAEPAPAPAEPAKK
ncbi:MAG: hypothetical protein KBE09_01855 [Candidatus Pacebacteria bacterium]|nr:hypothetical protein [Candidatus Paceibacterota bacterium]